MKKSELDKTATKYREGTKILVVFIIIATLFLSAVAYITCLEIFKGDEYMNNPYNQRQWVKEQSIIRGDITDRDGELLAYSEKNSEGVQERIYKYPELFAHTIGYSSKVYGKSQLEFTYNKNLAGLSEASNFTDISSVFAEEKKGDNVELTLSYKLQKKAQSLLRGRNGSVVAMNPKTGEVLCMVSSPSYKTDNTSLSKNWLKLSENEDAPFLNRATSGLYPPGSIIKTIILSAALENGLENEIIDDSGTIEINGTLFNNTKSKAYGELNLERAFNVSSNVAFINLGVKLGEEEVREYYKKFCIGSDYDFDIPKTKSRFGYKNTMKDDEIALTAIGQGNVLVTPMQMAMMTSAIANKGNVPQPYLVKRVTNSTGVTVLSGRTKILSKAILPETAEIVKDYMVSTVKNGTAGRAAVRGIDVAGKTGTAENEKENKEHAWFVGFAPADDPQIAVAVIIEYDGGTGGGSAAPIASELFNLWLN